MNGLTGPKWIGLALKGRRIMKGMLLEDLASKTGLSVSYISLIERALRIPSLTVFLTLCLWLDIEPSELLKMAEQLESESE